MSCKYDEYLMEHKANVARSFNWIRYNLPEITEILDSSDINAICFDHDSSKYWMEEYYAYDAYFFGEKRTKLVEEKFNLAWLHHIRNNPHHWQHWVIINDDPEEGETILEMPYNYIVEMVCDWWAFSWNKGNPHEIFDWYDKHKDHIKLHPTTRDTVNYILNKIKNKLEEIEK